MRTFRAACALLSGGLLAGAGLVCAADAPATTPAPIPVTDFAKKPKFASITFAPGGNRFAGLQELDGRRNLVVGDLDKQTLNRITSFATYDVGSYQWISDTRLVLTLFDAKKGLGEQRGGGLYAINFDGSEPKELSPTIEGCGAAGNLICRQTHFVERISGSATEIIASANERDASVEDLYRLDTRTGRKKLLTSDNPGQVAEWFLDADHVPRAAISEDGKKSLETFWFKDDAAAPWRKVSSVDSGAQRMKPAGFDADGTLLVYSNIGSDKYKLYQFDPANNRPGKLLLEHPRVDLDTATLATDLKTHRVLGIFVEADKPEVVWFDEAYARLQKLMDTSLPPGNINRMQLLADGRVSVLSFSDRDPGQYYLFDPKKRQLEEVLRPLDWIKPAQMSATQVVRYKARDGLEIPGYLTLPQGKPPTKLPLIAWIHGGPWVRDNWGYDPDVQFLASRGYAVFQPNYRGSTGFGRRHYIASYHQLGQSMQDDITDGVQTLIAQGTVDADRVCIGGGSYGGYATMMGLIKEPGMFKCGIDEAGVVDLIWWQELAYTDFNLSSPEEAEVFLKRAIGDLTADRAMLQKYSPRLHADKVNAPVLIVHAVQDQRVPIAHAEAMRDALKSAGKPFEYVVYPDEAHGFVKFENRVDRYNKIEAFLQKNLGP